MSEITGTRLLRKLTDGGFFYMDGESDWAVYGSNWEIYTNNSGIDFGICRGYFDIAGWSSEQLTAFISGAGWQESDSFHLPHVTLGLNPTLQTWDIVSKAAIANESLEDEHWMVPADGVIWSAPGMLDSHYNLEEIFAGRQRNFALDSNMGYALRQSSMNIWGAGDATAGDKIYFTRIVKLTGLQIYPGGQAYIPPQAIIVPATLVDEKDLEYMERLRRSYVLAESRNP